MLYEWFPGGLWKAVVAARVISHISLVGFNIKKDNVEKIL